MDIRKRNGRVEISAEGFYMDLPATQIGYKLMEKELPGLAPKYKDMFVKKVVVRKVLKK